jgi:EAL domain-containing protein (putative c-di-GMP-specific phosphodiesterase class I)/AmiR/NasT family two-component response regulator
MSGEWAAMQLGESGAHVTMGSDTRKMWGGALSRFSSSRILIVDDEPANLALLRNLLTRQGIKHIYELADSRETLAWVARIDPDLVLLDLHMPGVDGYEVLGQLRSYTAGSYVPVLVLTADTTTEAIQRALELGARDFLTKPFDLNEATLRMRNLLETRELHMTLRHHNVRLRDKVGAFEQIAFREREERKVTVARIEQLLSDRAFRMVVQPIFEVPGNTIVGCEALARFPAEPLQPPDRWFADADIVGLGTRLELAAVAVALNALPELPSHLFLAVNVSPATAMAPQLATLLDGVDCERVVLELTEHVPVEDYDAMRQTLAVLRARGVRLAIDDTGAGYSGFRHLIGLQPDIIKLDISLTRDVDHDVSRRALAAALVSFGRDIGAQVVAEGVENAGELATLEHLGVTWVQGYFLGRPLEIPDFLELPLAIA